MSALPLSAAELCEAMRHARPFDATRLNRVLALDAQRGLLEVQGATAWTKIAAELRPGDARAAAVRTAMPTVAESVARNTAGPDGQPAVAHVHSLTLVTPEGDLRRVSRERDPELFSLAVGGQGLFGVFYSVTLRLDTLGRAVERAMQPQSRVLRDGTLSERPLEVLVPPEVADRFIAETDARCNDWRMPLARVEMRRTEPEHDSFLRWACRDFVEIKLAFSAHTSLGASVRSAQLRRELLDAALSAGGRFHIASAADATREQLDACYPQVRAFLQHKRRFDPHERLSNRWYVHQRSLLAAEECAVRWGS